MYTTEENGLNVTFAKRKSKAKVNSNDIESVCMNEFKSLNVHSVTSKVFILIVCENTRRWFMKILSILVLHVTNSLEVMAMLVDMSILPITKMGRNISAQNAH